MTPAKSEKDWQAENDAETLARAAEIKADKKRMSAAASAAKKMVDDAAVRTKALKRVARTSPKKTPQKPMKKSMQKRKR